MNFQQKQTKLIVKFVFFARNPMMTYSENKIIKAENSIFDLILEYKSIEINMNQQKKYLNCLYYTVNIHHCKWFWLIKI